MKNFGIVLILFSFIGIVGMTIGPVLLAWFFYQFKKIFNRFPLPPVLIQMINHSVDIIIPVHNQANALQETMKALAKTKNEHKVFIALNACTDTSIEVAKLYQVEILENENSSKWKSLKDFTACSKAEWILVLDPGAILSPAFFEQLNLEKMSINILGIAPRYYPAKMGHLMKFFWFLECWIKRIENKLGGPISVHGTSVIYRREKLLQVFASLNKKEWLNDEVAIPFWMRFQNPLGSILYRHDILIFDSGSNPRPLTLAQKQKIIIGNLEWMTFLWPIILSGDFTLFILSLRRGFFILWAFWPSFFLWGMSLYLMSCCWFFGVGFLTISLVLFFMVINLDNELSFAYKASLLVLFKRKKL